MHRSLGQLIDSYDANAPLADASTIPAAWYIDTRIFDLERRSVFSSSWQFVGRVDQVRKPGQYVCCDLGAEPIIVVRGSDNVLRGFFNVCRHHAAAILTEPEGSTEALRCPYHGWTYSLEGALKGTPDFLGVRNFDRSSNGLLPVDCDIWENWVFGRVQRGGPALDEFLGRDLRRQIEAFGLGGFAWMERRSYLLDCNWKVFVDNYLDGGYHVPHVHKGLDSVLDHRSYTVENGARFCLQSSPLVSAGADQGIGAVRKGDRAFYYWIYPNFMINCYGDGMDTNLVVPRAVDKTEVIFDFYFSDVSEQARERNLASIGVSHEIQHEDVSICASVQKGLASRAYESGRLSVRREGGEHLFHRLLHADLKAGLTE